MERSLITDLRGTPNSLAHMCTYCVHIVYPHVYILCIRILTLLLSVAASVAQSRDISFIRI